MEQRIDLHAVAFPANTPITKVLAIVRQHTVVAFTDSGARPDNDFITGIFALILKYPDGISFAEMLKISDFDRARVEWTAATTIVGNATVAKVNSVMYEELAWTDQMRAHR